MWHEETEHVASMYAHLHASICNQSVRVEDVIMHVEVDGLGIRIYGFRILFLCEKRIALALELFRAHLALQASCTQMSSAHHICHALPGRRRGVQGVHH
jgi:hypothetical protein